MDIQLHTDPSDIGFGCVFDNKWLFSAWPAEWAPSKLNHINVRELFAVWVAVRTWADNWVDEVVIFSDNQAVIDVWSSSSTSDVRMMAIIRAIFFRCAEINLNLVISHIPGKENANADLLSRLQVAQFVRLNPNADPEPEYIEEDEWTLRGGC